MFKTLLVTALVASLTGSAYAASPAPVAKATVAPAPATPAPTLAPAPAKVAPKSFVLPTPTPSPTPKPVAAVGGGRFDLFATVPVSENVRDKNLGLAVGYRLVRLGDLSLSPLVNFNYIQNNPTAQPGLALTGHVGRNYDLGAAEIVRPCGYVPTGRLNVNGSTQTSLVCNRSFSMNRASYETSVVFGVRF